MGKLPKEEFYLAILGLFKRGKSTLINALLGQAILPTGVIPATSVITRIRYGDQLAAKITFDDASEKQVPVDDLAQYVTEAGNPDNEKKVAIADVFVPAPILKDGMVLIDTPGVGSTHLRGTKVTLQFLDRVDFSVFVLAVDPPVGQQELQLLSSLTSRSNKVLFVLNKIDYVDSASLEESTQYCRKILSEQLGAGFSVQLKIYPLSAKYALEGRLRNNARQVESSGIETLEAALTQSLLREKQKLILESTSNKLQKAASDLKFYVQLRIRGLTTPAEKFAQLRLEFEGRLELIQRRKHELFYVVECRAKEIVAMLDEDLAVFKKGHESTLMEGIEACADEAFRTEKMNSRQAVSRVEGFLRKALIETYSEFIRSEDQRIENSLQRLVSGANEEMNTLIGDVNHQAEELFGFQTERAALTPSLNFKTRFYYHLDPIFLTGVSFSDGEIAEWLPKAFAKGILKRRIEERVRDEFDKNGGRIRYDYFVTRINQALLNLKRDVNQALDASIQTAQRAVQQTEDLQVKSELEVSSTVAELKTMLAELECLGNVRREA